MRRIAAVALVASVVLVPAILVPYRAARTQTRTPDRAGDRNFVTVNGFSLGEIFEGDGPSLESLPPGALDALPKPPQAAHTDDIPAPEGYPVDFKHYPEPEEINAFLDALARDYPDLVESYEIGATWQGRPVRAMRVANEKAGDRIHDRPAMYLDGQHHARELISNQVALYTLWWLVHHYGKDPLATHLLDTRVLYVNPSVNPDGNQIVLHDNQITRKTANPSCCDDDGDGRVDEDHSLDYGYGTDDVALYEFNQEWADLHPTDPFQMGWQGQLVGQPRGAGRFTGALGGPRRPLSRQDMDGDGRQNEDEIGGTDPNRNYDWFWQNGDTRLQSAAYRGPAVWSEPETRAVRDFVTELDHLATALSYHSGVDLILYPWAYSTTAVLPDAPLYELLSRKGSQLTEVNGFRGSPRTWIARGLYDAAGSSVDYFYGELGVLNWAPEVYGADGRTRIDRVGATGVFSVGQSTGFGFNPRPEQILASTDRWNRYALYILAATPNIELNVLGVVGDQLVIRLGNDGILPVKIELALDAADGSRLRVVDAGPVQGWQTTFAIPLAQIRREGNRLSLTSTLLSGTRPHVVETAEWQFSIPEGGAPRLDAGRLVPYTDLGMYFGGWWAGEEWNAEAYRCPETARTCPEQIIANPPVAPDPNRPAIAAWEPVAASPTPERPGKVYLPRAVSGGDGLR